MYTDIKLYGFTAVMIQIVVFYVVTLLVMYGDTEVSEENLCFQLQY
jgi:uncharacterized membrane protein YjfL (UPF0719 family)